MIHENKQIPFYFYYKIPDENGWVRGIRFDHPECSFFPDYSINMNGDVYSHNADKIMLRLITAGGYQEYQLYNNGKVYHCRIHRLVALNFLPRTKEDIELGRDYINHKDMNVINNHVSNLEWCTVAENNRHALIYGERHYKKYEWFKASAQYMLQNGMRIKEVYDIFKNTGISEVTILHWARDLGIRYTNEYDNEFKEKVKSMLQSGMRCSEIATYFREEENFNVPYTTINNISQQLGINRKKSYKEYMDDIVNDLKSGMTRKQAYEKWNPICGISDSGMGKIITRYGLSKIDNSYKKYLTEIEEDVKNGATPIELSRKWGITRAIANRLAKEFGYESGINRGKSLRYTDRIIKDILYMHDLQGLDVGQIAAELCRQYGAGSREQVRKILLERKRVF